MGVIQARTLSSRLPGKALLSLLDSTSVIEIVRARTASLNFEWWLATTDHPSDDRLASLGEKLELRVLRGNQVDVLSRYEEIARNIAADFIVKLNADNPTVGEQAIRLMLAEAETDLGNKAMLADFGPGRRYPQGHLPQILRTDVVRDLRKMIKSSGNNSFHKTHVTSILLTELTKQSEVFLGPERPELRWSIDYPLDLVAMRALFKNLPTSFAQAGYRDFLDSEAGASLEASCNSNVRQKDLSEG